MSIGKRLIDLARSELNSLLDRAAQIGDGEDDRPRGRGARLEDLSDEELEAEIERRRREREYEQRAARARAEAAARGASGARNRATGGARPGAGARGQAGAARPRGPVDEVAKAYAALEVPPGSDFETVRKAYRQMMRKYHPDRHASSPEKQRAATELAQKLTESYKVLEKRLRK